MPSSNPAYQKVVSRNNNPFEGSAATGISGASSEASYGGDTESTERLLQQEAHNNNNSTMMDSSTQDDREVPGHIPTTNSSEELMPHGGGSSDSEEGGSCVESGKVANPSIVVRTSAISKKEMFTVFVLCFVNLINYMDRLTIAGECLDECSRQQLK